MSAPPTPTTAASSAQGTGPDFASVRGLPVVLDLRTAARILHIGRNRAYQLARTGDFPCPVLRVGATWRVPTAGLLTLLGLTPPTPSTPPPAEATAPPTTRPLKTSR